MRKTWFLLIIIWILALGGFWFLQHEGFLQIEWLGWRARVPLLTALLMLFFSSLLFWMGIVFIARLSSLPRRWRLYFLQKNEKKGREALLQTFVALANEDVFQSKRLLNQASSTQKQTPAWWLADFQLATLQKDHFTSQEALEMLKSFQLTKGLALRILFEQAVQQEHWQEAMKLLSQAWQDYPERKWVKRATLTLLKQLTLTSGTEWKLPESQRILKGLPFLEYTHPHDQALWLWQQALWLAESHHYKGAIQKGLKAYKRNPLASYAKSVAAWLTDIGKKRAAVSLLEDAWQRIGDFSLLEARIALLQEVSPHTILGVLQHLQTRIQDRPLQHAGLIMIAVHHHLTAFAQELLLKIHDTPIGKELKIWMDAVNQSYPMPILQRLEERIFSMLITADSPGDSHVLSES